ncbi:ribosome biogenesis GTPase [Motilibacter peucedani]|uniref:Small ribosomal subunit biogenesis GTPase RsgA n=1 Tax=Motilibacter peucedani TaxID=598650 RepID=A0A420XS37_9ACTN|nr:ribosome small subunit-dependent GTPase A [Motilibacter peucedani]RKS77705.1 ribosome biogenesis GTPase [Motilibacter peucedani]
MRTPSGPLRAAVAPALLARALTEPAAAPAVGDSVLLDDGRVVEVLPRRTCFQRLSAAPGTSAVQVLAANVDVAVVVEPLQPEPHAGRVERLLALAWESGAQPLVVLTKADLAPDADALREEVAGWAPGVDVLVTSSSTGEGLELLTAYASPGTTLCLLGPSGAGKSSLVAALGGAAVVGETRADGKGRHTTVHRELVELAGGAFLLDTPGLRGIGVAAGEEALALAFADVEALAQRCRFADCRHAAEPGCAVQEAIESGELAERRLASWRKLEREAAWIARRQDVRLQAVERARWKALHKEVRRSGRVRP